MDTLLGMAFLAVIMTAMGFVSAVERGASPAPFAILLLAFGLLIIAINRKR